MSSSSGKRSIGKHACERCRKSKIRCLLDTFDDHEKCRRCFSADLDCTWKEISTTRRRKRTDVRVAELEKQIKSFETVLTNMGHNVPGEADVTHDQSSSDRIPCTAVGNSTNESDVAEQPTQRSCESSHARPHPSFRVRDSTDYDTPPTSYHHTESSSPLTDLLDGSALSTSRQAELVQDFIDLLLPQYPIVDPASMNSFRSFAQLKPLLTATILVAACSVSEPHLFERLHTRMVRILGELVLVQGQKSLEIVQAILVCAVWYSPPADIGNLTFQLCNMAGTMSLELGLGGRTSWHANHRAVTGFKADVSDAAMEAFRSMFSVYLTCSRVAVSLRRQRMITFSPGTDIALKTFEEHATSANDKRLAAWVRLQLIAEDIEKMKTNVESRANSVFNDRDAFKNDLSLFSDRLADWQTTTNASVLGRRTSQPSPGKAHSNTDSALTEALRIDLCFCKGKLHELAIYADQNIEDLSVPFLSPAKAITHCVGSTDDLNPTYVRALLSFVKDCHSILDAVLATDVVTLRCCPLLTHLRIPYAFKALAMLHKALESPDKSNVGKVVDAETLNFRYYVGALGKHMEAASCQGLYSAPSTALKIRDLVARSSTVNPRPLPMRHQAEDDTRSIKALTVSENQPTESHSIPTGETMAAPNGNIPFITSPNLMLPQPDETFMLAMDDLDSMSFDFGPGFMDWTVW